MKDIIDLIRQRLNGARLDYCISPMAYRDVMELVDKLAQLQQHGVGGPASASALEGEQLGNEGSAKSVCGGVRNCNGNGIDNGLGYCIYCEEKIPSA
jgi:hypothetical protein